MALDPLYKMTIQDVNGSYYTASLNSDATWNVTLQPSLTYIEVLPDGWDNVSIVWERDPETVGIWRSSTEEGNYKFSMDGRAIIQFIYDQQGIRGYGLLTIWQWQPDFTYAKYYPSEFDFNTYSDKQQLQLLEISTLDSGLRRDYMAYKDKPRNIPIWAADGLGGWIPYYNNVWCLHQGMKLYYNVVFTSSASPTNPLIFGSPGSGTVQIGCFNLGQHGVSTPHLGYHTFLNLTQFASISTNGAPTSIGADILGDSLIYRQQSNSANGTAPGEVNFSGTNNSQPYTRQNFLIENLLVNPVGAPGATIHMNLQINASIIPVTAPNAAIMTTAGSPGTTYLGFALFEIDKNDNPETISGQYTPHAAYQLPITTATSYPDINVSIPVIINYNKAYVGCLITDGISSGIDGSLGITYVGFTNLTYTFTSKFDGGASGIPIPAPQLNPSVFAGYRGHQLLELLTPLLAAQQTDSAGFPIPLVPAPYTGRSDYLSNPASQADYDTNVFNIVFSSQFCVQNLQGQSYITSSISQIRNFFQKQVGMGMSIENDLSGNPTVLRMEPYSYYFPDCTDITNMGIDLGFNVTGLEIEDAGQSLGLAANIDTGYQEPDLNSDYGVDIFCFDCFWYTPVPQIPGTMDYNISDVVVDGTAIEKMRQKQINQPIGGVYNPAQPSNQNQTVAVYVMSNNPPFALPDPPYIYCQPIDPNNNPVAVLTTLYQVEQFDGVMNPAAQSLDPTAAAAPYIGNMPYYPDTAINIKLAPGRMWFREAGGYIHSLLAKMDTMKLVFGTQSQMQYNNVVSNLSGITTKLSATSKTVTEMQDKLIYDLPDPFFQPKTIKITATYLVNMWQIWKTKPNFFIRFYWRNEGIGYKEYRFYPDRVEYVTNQKATSFVGRLCVGYPV